MAKGDNRRIREHWAVSRLRVDEAAIFGITQNVNSTPGARLRKRRSERHGRERRWMISPAAKVVVHISTANRTAIVMSSRRLRVTALNPWKRAIDDAMLKLRRIGENVGNRQAEHGDEKNQDVH